MSTASETSPLLSRPPPKKRHQKHCSCHVKYRLPKITEKGAIVMIVCNVLVFTAIFAQLQRFFFTTITSAALTVMAMVTFPIVGIVADTRVGRFKVIQASICFSICFITAQHTLNISARLPSNNCRNHLCALYNRIMLRWQQLLCSLCISLCCRPADRSIWRTA